MKRQWLPILIIGVSELRCYTPTIPKPASINNYYLQVPLQLRITMQTKQILCILIFLTLVTLSACSHNSHHHTQHEPTETNVKEKYELNPHFEAILNTACPIMPDVVDNPFIVPFLTLHLTYSFFSSIYEKKWTTIFLSMCYTVYATYNWDYPKHYTSNFVAFIHFAIFSKMNCQLYWLSTVLQSGQDPNLKNSGFGFYFLFSVASILMIFHNFLSFLCIIKYKINPTSYFDNRVSHILPTLVIVTTLHFLT
jgi:hypothetical protein